jgi:hypothetical protein
MNVIHLTGDEPGLQAIVRAAFPQYNGRKFRLEIATHPINVKSYWDGGSRDYFVFVQLSTLRAVEMPAQSAYDVQIPGAHAVTLPDGIACVEHSIFCGKDSGITIHLAPSNATPFLPAPSDLSRWERIVLSATRSYKNSYNGVSDCRLMEAQRVTGITRDAWTMASDALKTKGLLNKAGAITVSGRNAIGQTDLHTLRETDQEKLTRIADKALTQYRD